MIQTKHTMIHLLMFFNNATSIEVDMNRSIPPESHSTPPAELLKNLSPDLRARVNHLLVQLAYKHVVAQSKTTTMNLEHVVLACRNVKGKA